MAFQSNNVGVKHSIESDLEKEDIKYETISLVVKNIRTANKDTGFFVFEGEFPKGTMPPRIIIDGEVHLCKTFTVQGVSNTFTETDRVGQIINCVGKWQNHPTYGLQFQTLFINEKIPRSGDDSISTLETYLSSGRIKFIGKSTAKLMISKWGKECFEILDKNFYRLTELPTINEEKALKIHEEWLEKNAVYEIVSYLGLHGVGESLANKVFNFFKEKQKNNDEEYIYDDEKPTTKNVLETIKKNPYILTNVDGIGFSTADRVALSLGFSPEDPLRLYSAIFHELNEKIQKDGNMAIPVTEWIESSARSLQLSSKKVHEICQSLVNERQVVLRKLPVTTFPRMKGVKSGFEQPVTKVVDCVSPNWCAYNELNIAKEFKRLIDTQPEIKESSKKKILKELNSKRRNLDLSQKEAAWTALSNPFSVITGGPGSGKTTTLKTIVEIAEKALGLQVVLAAPTGKAAKRMNKAIGRESQTIHRRLDYKPPMGFQNNRYNKLIGDLFIIDENSMVDSPLFLSWLEAIPDGAMVLFVGDADQLPSVGCGDVMRDLMASGVIPVSRLRGLHRTGKGSTIPINAALVNSGKPPRFSGNVWRDDYAFVNSKDDVEIFENLLKVVEGLIKKGTDPKDIQILSAQKNGTVGTENLNETLRLILNENATVYRGFETGIPSYINGERLMQIKNNYDSEIFNGDMGYLQKYNEKEGTFEYVNDDNEVISLTTKNLKEMIYGYAITVHKSQGSENPVIIIPLSSNHQFTLNRNLLYTAITRGKEKVIIIGSKETAIITAQKQSQQYRITGLCRELRRFCPKWEGKLEENLFNDNEDENKENKKTLDEIENNWSNENIAFLSDNMENR